LTFKYFVIFIHLHFNFFKIFNYLSKLNNFFLHLCIFHFQVEFNLTFLFSGILKFILKSFLYCVSFSLKCFDFF